MKHSILLAAWLLLPTAAMADSFTMNPGKWEFTTSMTMPMFPKPQITTTTDCITEEEATKDPISDLVNDGNCRILNRKKKGNRLSFEMECRNEGTTSRGKGHFISKGNSASGSMEMTIKMPQMPAGTMTMKTSWQGKRIGACN